MFSFTLVLIVFAITIAQSEAGKGSGFCPIKESIKNCLPKCISDYECIANKRCCPNVCNSKSCADVTAVYSGNNPHRTENNAVICGNVKCQPLQKCISDGPMKRPTCSW